MKKGQQKAVAEWVVPDIGAVVAVFNHLFEYSENTKIMPGGNEPLYSPRNKERDFNVIISNQDFVSSALHEISHWCIAGSERRLEEDYGYWYEPDGRTDEQQRLFEQVEVKPQAIEWMFSVACNQRFNFSADNLDNPNAEASETFKQSVKKQVESYLSNGMPDRAQLFFEALQFRFNTQSIALDQSAYSIA